MSNLASTVTTSGITARLIILNTCWAALVVWASVQGYTKAALDADPAHIGLVIIAVFAAGIASTAARAIEVHRSISSAAKKRGWAGGERQRLSSSIRKMQIKNEHLIDFIEGLVLIGLIGNAIGFFIAFHQVDVASLGSSDAITKGAANMLGGLGTAFGSTLIGCILALWTTVNYRVLATATALHLEESTQ